MAVTVLFDKAYHTTQLSVSSTELTVCTISNTELVAGHRYLVFGTIHTLGGSHGAFCRLNFGGSPDNNIRGDYSSPGGGSNVHQYKGCTLWTAVAGQDITLTVQRSNSNNGVARNCSLMAIDLDSAGLVENEDWFHVVDSSRSQHVHHSFSQPSAVIENQAASTLVDGETFTIDDTEGNVQTFEFDISGDGVTPGNIAVTLNPGDSSSTVRTAIINAINGASPLNVFASTQGSTSYTLVRPNSGASQKINLSDTVANSSWVFADWNPAVLTFTPDGTSDYLCIGVAAFDNIPGNMIMRLRDVTNSTTVFQSGIGTGNLGNEEHCYTGWGIKTAPPASPITLVTEYRSFSAAEKDEARIIVIRLNSFANFTYFDIDEGSTPPANTNRTQRGSTLSFTPDSTGEVIVFGSVQSEGDGSFSTTSRGIAGDVTRDGTKIWDSQSYAVQWHGDNSNYTGTDGSVVGPWIFELLTGETPNVEQSWELYSTSPSTSGNDLRQMMLLVMSTQEFVPPPDQASNPSPSNGATDIFLTDDLSWDVTGEGTLTSDVYFGTNQTDVTNGTGGTFKGNQATTTYEPGILELNTTYYWRIDEVSEGGTTTGDVWSFTTVVFLPPPGQPNSPTPENGATFVELEGKSITWGAAVDANTYEVYFGKDEDGVTSDILMGTYQSAQTELSFVLPTLDPGTTYYWRIDTVGYGGRTTGNVWHFTTIPVHYEYPNSGDKVFSVVSIKGRVPPLNGVHTELHTDEGLIADGYTIAAENGQFSMSIPFSNQEPGTKIRAVSVSQASPDSPEVTVTLVQAAQALQPVVTRSGRRLQVDANTVALWPMNKTIRAESQTTGSAPKLNFDFSTIGGDVHDPPSNFTGDSSSETLRPEFKGTMTYYNFNVTSSYSRMWRSNDSSYVPQFSNGFTIKFRHRDEDVNPFTPTASNHTILYSVIDGTRWRVYGGVDTFTIINDQGSISFGLPNGIDFTKDWTEIEVRGYELDPGNTSSHYIELYINDQLTEQTWATTTSGTALYLGNAFTGASFISAEFDTFRLMEANPFIERIGTNVKGNSALDLRARLGCNLALADDNEVPFTHCARFDGSQGYMYSDDAAFDIGSPFTIEGWFRAHSVTGDYQYIVSKEAYNSNGWGVDLDANMNIRYNSANGSGFTLTGPQILTNRWYHFAMTHDGSNLSGYLDGELVDTISAGITANTTNSFAVGRRGSSATFYFDGDIADIRFSNVVRAPWEIYNTYHAADDPKIGFVEDEHTMVIWDFSEDPGRQIMTSNRSIPLAYNALASYADTDDFRRFFPAVGDSLLGNGSNDVFVSGGNIVLRNDHIGGDYSQVFIDSRGGLRVTGNFDFRIDMPSLPSRPQPWATSSTDRSEVRMRTASGVAVYIVYDEWFDGSNNRNRIYSYLYSTISTTEFGAVVPSSISTRFTREGNKWRTYYGINGAEPTTLLGQATGPEDDCWIQIGNVLRAEYATTGTFDYEWNNMQVRGFNNDERDGYLFNEIHGGSPRSEPLLSVSSSGEKARIFDGTADYVVIPANSEWDHEDLSVECWFQADTLHNGRLLNRIEVGGAGFSLGVGSDGYLAAEVMDNVGESVQLTLGTITAGAWHYVAFTYSFADKRLALYLDGRQLGQTENSLMTGNHVSTADVYMGIYWPSTDEYFDGSIGAVRVSNSVRTSTEIFERYKGARLKR